MDTSDKVTPAVEEALLSIRNLTVALPKGG